MATPRQKIAAKKFSENLSSDKPKSTGQILRESGYSDSVASAPENVLDTKGFREVLNEIAPDDYVANKLQEYLELEEVVVKNTGEGDFESVPTGQPHKDRLRAIDMLLKVKGQYAPEKKEIQHSGGLAQLTDEELMQLANDSTETS